MGGYVFPGENRRRLSSRPGGGCVLAHRDETVAAGGCRPTRAAASSYPHLCDAKSCNQPGQSEFQSPAERAPNGVESLGSENEKPAAVSRAGSRLAHVKRPVHP